MVHSSCGGLALLGVCLWAQIQVDPAWRAQMESRLAYGFYALLGAAMALAADKPKQIRDFFHRIFVGFSTGFLFAEPFAGYLGLKDTVSGMFTATGALGIVSWYGLGLVVGFCTRIRDSEFAQKWIMGKILPGGDIPEQKKPEDK